MSLSQLCHLVSTKTKQDTLSWKQQLLLVMSDVTIIKQSQLPYFQVSCTKQRSLQWECVSFSSLWVCIYSINFPQLLICLNALSHAAWFSPPFSPPSKKKKKLWKLVPKSPSSSQPQMTIAEWGGNCQNLHLASKLKENFKYHCCKPVRTRVCAFPQLACTIV